jgi:hypothetical protein
LRPGFDFARIPIYPPERADGAPISTNEGAARAFAAYDSASERLAREVAARSRATMPATGPLVTEPGGSGDRTLSPSGRAHFEPIVGGSLDRARFHVDGRAAQVARLAQARAVTVDRDVFIPPERFAPSTPDGRALIAHELAHVAHGARDTMFRDSTPHYPAVSEQGEIRDIIGLHGEATNQPATADEKPHFVDTGQKLDPKEAVELAKRLKTPLVDMLAADSLRKKLPEGIHDTAEAFDIVQKAQKAVKSKFGSYFDHDVTLTKDATTSPEQREAAHQVFVSLGVGDDAAESLANARIQECDECKTALAPLSVKSQAMVRHVLLRLVMGDEKVAAQLKAVAEAGGVGGEYEPERFQIDLPRFSKDPYGAAVHEVIHAMTHPAFRAAFPNTPELKEGITEHFAVEVRGEFASYAKYQATVDALLAAMRGPFRTYSVDSPEESLRLAYFKGRLDLIGWQPSSDKQRDAVEAAGGPDFKLKIWDPKQAATEETERDKRARAIQEPHANLIGVGLFFQKEGGGGFSLRYARVLYRSPLARFQVPLEGELVGSPTRLGASLGAGLEFQEPWLYATGGLRVVGSGALSGPVDDRVDLSPFAGIGTRLFQRVRVGAEGFVLLPVAGDKRPIDYGGGLRVGVEF